LAGKTDSLAGNASSGRAKGMALVLSGAVLWGVSGNAAQYLFNEKLVSPGWLTSVRMLSAGFLLLLWSAALNRKAVWGIWTERRSARDLLIFGLIGMIGSQYTYFEAVAAGNAATATLLQYLNPVLIMSYLILRWRRKPNRVESAAILLALAGVFFIVTRGHPGQLSLAPAALFWGLLSALGGAIYSCQPSRLLKKWGAAPVVGWGMIIGGTAMSLFYPPWIFHGQWSGETLAGMAFVIFLGTFLSFYLYLASLKYLQPIETSLLGCAEPLSAAAVSVTIMKVPFTVFDWLGAFCIIMTVVILSFPQKR
jgi:drug/metabolite transporter (DMT)-like permease